MPRKKRAESHRAFHDPEGRFNCALALGVKHGRRAFVNDTPCGQPGSHPHQALFLLYAASRLTNCDDVRGSSPKRAGIVAEWKAIERGGVDRVGVECGIEMLTNAERIELNALARKAQDELGRLHGPEVVLETLDGQDTKRNFKHVKGRGEGGLWMPVHKWASWHAALCASEPV